MADQQIENIVDEIVEIVLTDADIRCEVVTDGVGREYFDHELDIDPTQRAKLVSVFERLFKGDE